MAKREIFRSGPRCSAVRRKTRHLAICMPLLALSVGLTGCQSMPKAAPLANASAETCDTTVQKIAGACGKIPTCYGGSNPLQVNKACLWVGMSADLLGLGPSCASVISTEKKPFEDYVNNYCPAIVTAAESSSHSCAKLETVAGYLSNALGDLVCPDSGRSGVTEVPSLAPGHRVGRRADRSAGLQLSGFG